MPMLVSGKCDEDADHNTILDGQHIRSDTKFRHWITAVGPSGFKAKTGRYHLYLAYWCPWAYCAAIFRKLNGLEDVISVSIASSSEKEKGWKFVDGEEGCIPEYREWQSTPPRKLRIGRSIIHWLPDRTIGVGQRAPNNRQQ